MNTPDHSQGDPTPEEFELSQDQELWDLLGQSKAKEASPLLSRNVLREIRLEESDSTAAPSFWIKFLDARFLFLGGMTALALVAAFNWNSAMDSKNRLAEATDAEALPVAVATSLEDSLESELLVAAANTPSLFSDEEVIAMLF